MAFTKEEIYKRAKEKALGKKLFFIEQVVAYSGISKTTFYDKFPLGSHEMNAIKEILQNNRSEIKSLMLKKWYDSDNATLQMGLMKLIATEEQAHRLNGSKTQSDINVNNGMSIVVDNEQQKKEIEDFLDEI